MDKIVVTKQEEAIEDRLQMLDSFRFLHPEAKDSFTCWNTLKNARSTNYGTRIDYLLITPGLAPSLSTCSILSQVMGSDHCPVRAELKLQLAKAGPAPSLCSRFLFTGRQQKILNFFTARPKQQQNGQSDQKNMVNSEDRKQISSVAFLQKKGEDCRQAGAKIKTKASGSKAVVNKKVAGGLQKKRKVSRQAKAKEIVSKEVVSKAAVGFLKTKRTEDSRKAEVTASVSKAVINTAAVGFLKTKKTEIFPQAEASVSKAVVHKEVVSAWKGLLTGPKPVPLCYGHNEPCVIRTSKKAGPNLNCQFYCCARGEGRKDDKEARCNFFLWATKK